MVLTYPPQNTAKQFTIYKTAFNIYKYCHVVVLYVVLHCSFKRSFSAPECEISPDPPFQGWFYLPSVELFWSQFKATRPIGNRDSSKWDTNWPFGAVPVPHKRTNVTRIRRVELAPHMDYRSKSVSLTHILNSFLAFQAVVQKLNKTKKKKNNKKKNQKKTSPVIRPRRTRL